MTERARWAWLVIVLLAGLGGGLTTAILYTNAVEREGRDERVRIEREAQQDFCELLAVFDSPNAPPPTTDRGRQQQAAIAAYRAKRC